jgi:hypothetical protein
MSALPPAETENRHWQEGMAWRSELCPQFEVVDPCELLTSDSTDSTDGIVYHHPVGYRVRDYCTTLNVAFDLERVRRRAEAVASFAAARELWAGTATQANPYDSPVGSGQVNGYLASTDAVTITTSVSDPMEALGLLEERARQAMGGQQCFLHVPTRIATQLGAQIRRVGNLLYTQTDAVIVADPGYLGTGPGETDPTAPGVWCYATGPVTLRFGDIAVTEEPVSATINRRTNRREVWADRMFAATFDPCVHFACQIA